MTSIQTRGRITVKRSPDEPRILLVSVEIPVPGLGRAPRFLMFDEPIQTSDVEDGALLGWIQAEMERR